MIMKGWDHNFLSDPGIPGVRSMGPIIFNSMSERPCWDLTDVTLADEDTNSIVADDANKAIQDNLVMQVAPPGVKILNHGKWCHLMAKFAADASSATKYQLNTCWKWQ